MLVFEINAKISLIKQDETKYSCFIFMFPEIPFCDKDLNLVLSK